MLQLTFTANIFLIATIVTLFFHYPFNYHSNKLLITKFISVLYPWGGRDNSRVGGRCDIKKIVIYILL